VSASLSQQFEDFHRANPSVYNSLSILTRQWLRSGRGHLGMKMLFEVLRWQTAMATDDPHSDFKLNNNYTSRYARMLDAEFPGVFQLRELKS
jgi:hypothetical protein